MLIAGLTGSIGMGKSTAADRFRENGIAVFDADAKVHELYDGPIAPDIEAAFPGTVERGKVDRGKLSAALLREPARFAELESIVHPAIKDAERYFLRHEAAKGSKLAVLEVPLLFEAKSNEAVDCVIVVSARADIQQERVLSRPGMTLEKLTELLKRQLPDEEKRKRADFIVDTSTSIAACNRQIDAIIGELYKRPAHAFEKYWS